MGPPPSLPPSLQEDFDRKWDAFQQAAAAAGIEIPSEPRISASFQRVLSCSNFIAETCIGDPAVLADLVASGDLLRAYAPADYESMLQSRLRTVNDEETLCRVLRHCRRREMLRIACRDLAGWADLAETVHDLSGFAEACLDGSQDILYQWQCAKLGVPVM
jgi:glutamate-ammonia-ligase adenylyltransferase